MVNGIIFYIYMAIFSSIMFSQDFIDRLRVPIIIRTKVAVGYDNSKKVFIIRNSWGEEWGDNDSEEDEECYEFVLPISFTMPDGTTITVENEEGWLSLREWYMNNSESEEEPLLQYPVNIVLFDDEGEETTVTINNEEEMNALEEECWGNDGEGDRP